jgi:uncharacterized protein
MEYRRFGPLEWDVSILGFGCARLPTRDGKMFSPDIAEEEATRMVRYAIDQGVNYLDTAYVYHDGNSERFLGRALQDGYRERVRLATKSPIWMIEQPADFDRYLDEQLARLQTGYVDFYLMHGLNTKTWQQVRDLGLLRRAEQAVADGKVRHLGFSFHDRCEVFQSIVDGYDNWTFCQFIFNYLDVEFEAGLAGLHYAADRGLAVVVMEPIKAGKLAEPQPAVEALWAAAEHQRSQASWALQWVWDHPEVCVALSGMSTMDQVVENVACAKTASRRRLTAAEHALIGRVTEAYRSLPPA